MSVRKIVAIILVITSLGGCAVLDDAPTEQSKSPQITLEESKVFLREVEDDLFLQVPADQITSDFRRPEDKSSVQGCSDDLENPYKDGVFLAQRGTVFLSADTDLRLVMEQILGSYSGKEGWRASWESQQEKLEIKLVSPIGDSFYVLAAADPDGQLRFTVSSFGSCVPTPPGFNAVTNVEY